MVTVVEAHAGHYEVSEGRFGRSYVWRPRSVDVECDCGVRIEFTASEGAVCECGRDHEEMVRERFARLEDRSDSHLEELTRMMPDRSERCYQAELNELN
ncbi:MAG: hypothetical protein ACR2KW_06660 [Rubrobacter sp.]